MKIKRVIDLSQPIDENNCKNPAFPDTRVEICMRHEENGWLAEIITAATHVGTHVDSPLHRFKGGQPINEYSLDRFAGEALIVDLYHKNPGEEITFEDLYKYEDQIKERDNIFLCTGWTDRKKVGNFDRYINDSPWLGGKAAEFLAERKVNSVGIDHFSIGGTKPENVTVPHDILLSAGILIFEDMLLPKVLLEKERWFFTAFPVLLGSTSGSFVRIAAMEFDI